MNINKVKETFDAEFKKFKDEKRSEVEFLTIIGTLIQEELLQEKDTLSGMLEEVEISIDRIKHLVIEDL